MKHLVLLFVSSFSVVLCDLASYLRERESFLENENSRFLGSNLELTSSESLVNDYLMNLKYAELDYGFATADFMQSQNFLISKPKYDSSQVFQFIKQMPKGGAIHVHVTAITDLDFLVGNVTYRDNLFMCLVDNKINFRFAAAKPDDTADCVWSSVSESRQNSGNVAEFDEAIYRNLTLVVPDPFNEYPNINAVWSSFEKYFVTSGGLICYEPVFHDYFYKGLEEFYEDNVQYMEIRTTLPTIYRYNFIIFVLTRD
jgi:adenosine deaminase CECR1